MDFNFLQPVEESVLAHTLLMPEQVLGRSLKIHTLKDGFPELNNVKIAIIGLQETRNSFYDFHDTFDLDAFRLEFYGLYPGNWDVTIADFGTITNGASVEDTYFAVQQICDFTYKRSIIPIFIGGSQDITLPMYRAYSNLDSYINITVVDNRFDFGEPGQLISSKSYMSKIILDEPNRLFNFCNLGYQTFYNAQEELDLLDRLFFESYRLGNLVSDISLVEPVLRDTDLLSIDLKSMKSIETGSKTSYPNGFECPANLCHCPICRSKR
jgi:formiminoglutamase